MRRNSLDFIVAAAILAVLLPAQAGIAQEKAGHDDPWAPFRYFVGSWEGQGEGSPGASTGTQTFEFILNGVFLQVRNRSVFAPQERNLQGEVHEDVGIFSYDKDRQTFILRQFHVEGFVNQYVLESRNLESGMFVFVSESIENIPAGFKARLTYRIVDTDTFEQTFDLAAPGQEFQCYSVGVMKRKGIPSPSA